MRTYEVKRRVTGEVNDAQLGPVPFRFEAGTVTPATETEERALEHLVAARLATREGDDTPAHEPETPQTSALDVVGDRPKPARPRARPKPARPRARTEE